MNITQTTHSAKNVHGKNPWPSGDLNPGPLACGASALPTELPGRRDKPGSTKYFTVVSRSRYTVQTHKQDKTHQSTGSITDTYSPSLSRSTLYCGLFVLCSYVPNVLVYDACFFLHFLLYRS